MQLNTGALSLVSLRDPGGQNLSGRALAIDQPLGKGHVVMFALRPFWRWQTQGTYALGFNTIINWDHLDAGKAQK